MAVDNSCPIAQQLLANSNVIGAMIWKKRLGSDPWNDFVEKVTKAQGTGYNTRYSIVQRMQPVDLVTAEVAQPDGIVSACDPPITQIQWNGTEAKTLVMDTGGFITPDLCLEDLRDAVNAAYTVDAFVDGLDDLTAYTMYRQHQARFTNAAQYKVVVRTGAAGSDPYSATAFPTVPATGTMTYNRLKWIWEQIQWNGQGETFPYAVQNGSNIYAVLLGYEVREQLIRQDESLRQDLRFGNPGLLLDPLGRPTQPYRDFVFHTVMWPARWNFVNGAWEEVKPFSDTPADTTVGTNPEVSDAYKNATYEDLYVWNSMAYKMAVPELPDISWGRGRIKFKPQNYMGQWVFNLNQSKVCIDGETHVYNPFGDKIYGAAKFEFGSVEPRPDLAAVFRYRRCGFGNDSVTCST